MEQIVPDESILKPHEIRSQAPKNIFDLRFKDAKDALQWLAIRKLVKNKYVCEECQKSMIFRSRPSRTDQYAWRCPECHKFKSVRLGSFISNGHMSLQRAVIIVYMWCMDISQSEMANQLGLAQNSHTLVAWCNICREICKQYFELHPIQLGGLYEDGHSKIVEIDKINFLSDKKQRRMPEAALWVFGAVERETDRCFLVPISDTTKKTIQPIIEKHILPSSIIVSTASRSYDNLSEIDDGLYEHWMVTTEDESPDPVIHTETAMNMWTRAKRKLQRQCGTSDDLFPSYISEFMWRDLFKNDDIFAEFLISIAEVFPV